MKTHQSISTEFHETVCEVYWDYPVRVVYIPFLICWNMECLVNCCAMYVICCFSSWGNNQDMVMIGVTARLLIEQSVEALINCMDNSWFSCTCTTMQCTENLFGSLQCLVHDVYEISVVFLFDVITRLKTSWSVKMFGTNAHHLDHLVLLAILNMVQCLLAMGLFCIMYHLLHSQMLDEYK